MRFEIRYFFLEIGLSPKKVSDFKPHHILPFPKGMVAHAIITYWPNVGAFGPSVPQPPNLSSFMEVTIY